MQLKLLRIWQLIQAEKLFAKQEQNTHLTCTCRAYLRPQDAIFIYRIIYLGQFECLLINWKAQMTSQQNKWFMDWRYLPNLNAHFLNCTVLRINEISHSRSRNIYQIYLCLTVWIRSMHGISGYSNLQKYFDTQKETMYDSFWNCTCRKGRKIFFCIVGGS